MVVPDKALQNSVHNEGEVVAGTTNQNRIRIGESSKGKTTVKHEIGHSLGMLHSKKGLMTASSNDPNRSEELEQQNTNDVFDSANGNRQNNAQGVMHYK